MQFGCHIKNQFLHTWLLECLCMANTGIWLGLSPWWSVHLKFHHPKCRCSFSSVNVFPSCDCSCSFTSFGTSDENAITVKVASHQCTLSALTRSEWEFSGQISVSNFFFAEVNETVSNVAHFGIWQFWFRKSVLDNIILDDFSWGFTRSKIILQILKFLFHFCFTSFRREPCSVALSLLAD